jgi:hypothetical protein
MCLKGPVGTPHRVAQARTFRLKVLLRPNNILVGLSHVFQTEAPHGYPQGILGCFGGSPGDLAHLHAYTWLHTHEEYLTSRLSPQRSARLHSSTLINRLDLPVDLLSPRWFFLPHSGPTMQASTRLGEPVERVLTQHYCTRVMLTARTCPTSLSALLILEHTTFSLRNSPCCPHHAASPCCNQASP